LSNAGQQILLPFGHAEIFQENLKRYSKPLSTWTAVKVTKTESLEQTAKTLGVDPESLRQVNGIPKGMRIKTGSTVLIPKTSNRPGDVSSAMADNASLSLEKPPPPPPPSKCPKPTKGGKGTKPAKCPPQKSIKGVTAASKGNSSTNNAATQHKSASTDLAKSAKNGNSPPHGAKNTKKGDGKAP
jgi:membrane-bound lytic murein transglycosylase D